MEKENGRVYGLDILRALAVLFVVSAHGAELLPAGMSRPLFYVSLDGVSIFFVLSGFLIGGILIKLLETSPATFNNLSLFWFKRWMRTLPNYYFVLILLSLMTYLLSGGVELRSLFPYVFFVQNFASPQPDFFPESWSLSIEEWFYLVVPSILFVLSGACRVPVKRSIVFTAIAILVCITAIRYYRYTHIRVQDFDTWNKYLGKQVITRMDNLMFGLIGAYIAHYHRTAWVKYKKILLLIGISGFFLHHVLAIRGMLGFGSYACVLYLPVNATFVLLTLPALGEIRTGRGVVYRTLTRISLISYSMYLLNYSIIRNGLINRISLPGLPFAAYPFARLLLFWTFTLAGSFLLYQYFERPVLALRDKVLTGEGRHEKSLN